MTLTRTFCWIYYEFGTLFGNTDNSILLEKNLPLHFYVMLLLPMHIILLKAFFTMFDDKSLMLYWIYLKFQHAPSLNVCNKNNYE